MNRYFLEKVSGYSKHTGGIERKLRMAMKVESFEKGNEKKRYYEEKMMIEEGKNSCWSLWSAVEGTQVLDYEKRKSEFSIVGLKFLIIVTAFMFLPNLGGPHYKISFSLFIFLFSYFKFF